MMTTVDIYLLNSAAGQSQFLIFEPKHLASLRELARVCARPPSLSASTMIGQLTLVQVCSLVERFPRHIRLLECDTSTSVSPDDYRAYLTRFNLKQTEELRVNRKCKMLEMRDKILNGRRKKLQQQLSTAEDESEKSLLRERLANLERDFELELEAAEVREEADSSETKLEIFIKTPAFFTSLHSSLKQIDLDRFYLNNASLLKSCKYRAYAHFSSNGYFLTCGAKFGAHYLVYPDDPGRSHSQFLVVCADDEESGRPWTLKQLITYARMATSVKKTFILAYKPPSPADDHSSSSQLGFLSINWSHI
jgi:tRNA-intron lyase